MNIDLLNRLITLIDFYSKSEFTAFLKSDPEKDKVLRNNANMLIIMWIMSANYDAEKASLIPFELERRLGSLDIEFLSNINLERLETAMMGLHRFPKKRAGYVHGMAKIISKKYNGNVANIWQGATVQEIKKRLLEIPGFGPQLSNMVLINLIRNFKMTFPDIEQIDVKVDIHLKRVMLRTGLSQYGATDEKIALDVRKSAYQIGRYPMEFDLPLWATGKWYCHDRDPGCDKCPINLYCPKILNYQDKASTIVPSINKNQCISKISITSDCYKENPNIVYKDEFWETLKNSIRNRGISSSNQKVKSGKTLDVTMGLSGVFTNIEVDNENIEISLMVVTKGQMSKNSRSNIISLKYKDIEKYFDNDCTCRWNDFIESANAPSRQKIFSIKKQYNRNEMRSNVNFTILVLDLLKKIIDTYIRESSDSKKHLISI